jgi:succinate dehydrogenase / fumarate reductase flavoprotein subunit
LGKSVIEARYGNLFEIYDKITGEDPYTTPMRIYPAVHYTMGGLWVDYNLMTTVPGLYATGECNFSDHGANRLGASALMQGLADGYFVLPITIGEFLSKEIRTPAIPTTHEAFEKAEKEVEERINRLMKIQGTQPFDHFHKQLGKVMWEYCGMARTEEGLKKAKGLIQDLKADFWKNAIVTGVNEEFNQNLENAGRVADFLELGELMIDDALDRNESCGGHFRLESQTPEGEALRDDENYAYTAAWEFKGENQPEGLHKEELVFENVKWNEDRYAFSAASAFAFASASAFALSAAAFATDS